MKIRRATVTDRESELHAELKSLWEILESTPIRKLTQLKTKIAVGDRHVGVAVDERQARYMLIPCAAGRGAEGLWKSSAVALDRRNLVASDTTETWLVLSCLRHELDEIFLRLSANVLVNLASDPSEAIASCLTTLDAWRELLGPAPSSALTREQVLGLLGELLILEKLAAFDPARALESWEGPLGGRHDFRCGSHAIEAKASARRIGRFVTIHGPTQLAAPQDGFLHLSWTKFEAVPGGSLSLSSLVSRLETAGINKTRLSELLAKRGYTAAANPPEAETKYDIAEWMVWPVDGIFPRIIPASFLTGGVPNLILDLQYTIDLSGSWPAPLAPEGVELVWASIANAGSL
jgi:Putative  PD-(D/E)XK family member, (DUF4420)